MTQAQALHNEDSVKQKERERGSFQKALESLYKVFTQLLPVASPTCTWNGHKEDKLHDQGREGISQWQ